MVLPADNCGPQSDSIQIEHPLQRTDNIWQDHQRFQFLQQVNAWNMINYRFRKMQQQQHLIPQYRHAWRMANLTSHAVMHAAPADNVSIINFSRVHCPEQQNFPVPLHIRIPSDAYRTQPPATTIDPSHMLAPTPKSSTESSSELINILSYLH